MISIIQLQITISQKEFSRHPYKIRPYPTQRCQRVDKAHEISSIEIGGDSEDAETDHTEIDSEGFIENGWWEEWVWIGWVGVCALEGCVRSCDVRGCDERMYEKASECIVENILRGCIEKVH